MNDEDLLFEESLIRPAGRYPTLPSAFRDRVVHAAVRASRERTRRRRIWLVGSVLLLLSLVGGQALSNFAKARRSEDLASQNRAEASKPFEKSESAGPERMAALGNSDRFLTEIHKQLLKRKEVFLGIF